MSIRMVCVNFLLGEEKLSSSIKLVSNTWDEKTHPSKLLSNQTRDKTIVLLM